MKLRNKKTGKVIEWFNNTDGIFPNSLAELNEEWEDYEEPKEYWYINTIVNCVQTIRDDCGDLEDDKAIGNCFETKEEAEKAVEKLKAWKRLKGTITRIDRAGFDDVGTATLFIRYEKKHHKEVNKDLDLLFGGEEL